MEMRYTVCASIYKGCIVWKVWVLGNQSAVLVSVESSFIHGGAKTEKSFEWED